MQTELELQESGCQTINRERYNSHTQTPTKLENDGETQTPTVVHVDKVTETTSSNVDCEQQVRPQRRACWFAPSASLACPLPYVVDLPVLHPPPLASLFSYGNFSVSLVAAADGGDTCPP